jgi:hypothetical protein
MQLSLSSIARVVLFAKHPEPTLLLEFEHDLAAGLR